MFFSQKAWKEKCEGLEARVQELESEAQGFDAALAERDEKIASLEAAAAGKPDAEQIAKLTAERDAAITERDQAKAEAAPEKIEAKALSMLSSAEAPPAVQKVIAARVTEEMAKAGQPAPVPDAETEQSAASKLTGFAKVSAAFAAKK